jgi:hypothetical protein
MDERLNTELVKKVVVCDPPETREAFNVVSGRAVKRHTEGFIHVSGDKTLTNSPEAFSIASDHRESLIDFGKGNTGVKANAPV